MLLAEPSENVASIFARTRVAAEALRSGRGETAVFSELDLDGPREVFEIYSTPITTALGSHRFRHRVQIADTSEMPSVMALMKETYRGLRDRWFLGVRDGVETCFEVHLGGTLAGVAWASVVGEHGRLHSLTVRPGFRRLGIGTDLLFARLLWARTVGVREVISEIAESNLASRSIAERGGMRSVGRIYLYGKS